MKKFIGSVPIWMFILILIGVLIAYSMIASWVEKKMLAQKMAKQQQAAAQQQTQTAAAPNVGNTSATIAATP